jgi:hypothetical protein
MENREPLDYETPPPPVPHPFPHPVPDPNEYPRAKRLIGTVAAAGFGLLATYVEIAHHAAPDRFPSIVILIAGMILFALVAMGIVK